MDVGVGESVVTYYLEALRHSFVFLEKMLESAIMQILKANISYRNISVYTELSLNYFGNNEIDALMMNMDESSSALEFISCFLTKTGAMKVRCARL